MKKIFIVLIVGIVLLIALGIFTTAALSSETEGFITSIAEKRGISQDNITSVTQVDFNNLPEQVNIENVDETNLALYQIDVEGSDPVYVLTLSEETFQKTLATVDLKRSYLNFGFSGASKGAGFLQTATSVGTGLEKGYVMVRSGSITGMSTNLEVTKGIDPSQIEIVIYKNGEALGFGNILSSSSMGIKRDHDIQSEGTIMFEAGDIISVYLNAPLDVNWKDVITMIEVTTE